MHPQQPHYPAPGYIDLTVQGSVMTSSLVPPKVWINGYPAPSGYGFHRVPVNPGPAHIEVYAQWMRRYGQAQLDVMVQPGQCVPVFYALPWHQFTGGSIGHSKQSRNGAGAFIAMMSALMLIVLVPVLLILFNL
ncbi:hypothetical protein C6V83_14940 [Gordonia iterans]|uniref:Uncharacterized protein n=1 Tax=Gordonia iterans TaxID=1004901 RepID=A0A2S0KI43_9ACTN|nr:hypothetical protein [Gordonia iterans]AVM01344.1 hypothetical protein C6V83_14940 [Gordonia iterans]